MLAWHALATHCLRCGSLLMHLVTPSLLMRLVQTARRSVHVAPLDRFSALGSAYDSKPCFLQVSARQMQSHSTTCSREQMLPLMQFRQMQVQAM